MCRFSSKADVSDECMLYTCILYVSIITGTHVFTFNIPLHSIGQYHLSGGLDWLLPGDPYWRDFLYTTAVLVFCLVVVLVGASEQQEGEGGGGWEEGMVQRGWWVGRGGGGWGEGGGWDEGCGWDEGMVERGWWVGRGGKRGVVGGKRGKRGWWEEG